nr:MAG TPA: hypothetical protein [Caudoviricetes sp.]
MFKRILIHITCWTYRRKFNMNSWLHKLGVLFG